MDRNIELKHLLSHRNSAMNSPTRPIDSELQGDAAAQPLRERTLEMKYGERQIAAVKLITFDNPRIGRRYDIHITLPEFTCKCPFSGYPDFATIYLTYVPDELVVELKALKLYINGFRDRHISHEEAVNLILDDFVAACDPLEATVKADFNPRGNVHTAISVHHSKSAEFLAPSGVHIP